MSGVAKLVGMAAYLGLRGNNMPYKDHEKHKGNTMTDEQIKRHKKDIDCYSHREMARLFRFAPLGHIYFQYHLPPDKHFRERFKKLGGMTPAMSKSIGWEQ